MLKQLKFLTLMMTSMLFASSSLAASKYKYQCPPLADVNAAFKNCKQSNGTSHSIGGTSWTINCQMQDMKPGGLGFDHAIWNPRPWIGFNVPLPAKKVSCLFYGGASTGNGTVAVYFTQNLIIPNILSVPRNWSGQDCLPGGDENPNLCQWDGKPK